MCRWAFAEIYPVLSTDSRFSAKGAGRGAFPYVRTPGGWGFGAQAEPTSLFRVLGVPPRPGGTGRHELQLPECRAGPRPRPSRELGRLGLAASGALGLRYAAGSAAHRRRRWRRRRRCCRPAQPVWAAGGGRGRSAAGGRGRAAGGAGWAMLGAEPAKRC